MNTRTCELLSLVAILAVSMLACKKDDTAKPSSSTAGTTAGTTSGSTTSTTSGSTTSSTSGTTSGSTTGPIQPSSYTLGGTTFGNVSVACSEPFGFFKFTGESASGNSNQTITLYLGGGRPTSNRTYTVVPYTGISEPGKANIVMFMGSASNEAFKSTSGQLSVTLSGSVVRATFTDVQMQSMATGMYWPASGSLSCY